MKEDTAECPNCNLRHEYRPLLKSDQWRMVCKCGAHLRLEWDRVHTGNGLPEDIYWFENETS